MKKDYENVLEKEVIREMAWGILAEISKVRNVIGENKLLKELEKNFGDKIESLTNMTFEKVQELEVIIKFLRKVLKETKE